MIVTVDTDKGPLRLEETGFQPPAAGAFLGAAIQRRGLTIPQVANQSGLKPEQLAKVIDGEGRLDRNFCRKLEKVFPKTTQTLLRIQADYDFYAKYGMLRPDSPIQRALVMRRARAAA